MKLEHPFFQNSKCRKGYLHRFKVEREFEDGVLEVCEICHIKKVSKIVNGKVDNNRFMAYHLRQALGNIPIPHYIFHEYEYNPLESNIVSPYA